MATLLHRRIALSAWPALGLALVGCATRAPSPSISPPPPIETPGPRVPSEPKPLTDAEPTLEPIRAVGPNRPYVVDGVTYTPIAPEAPLNERGVASWYGRAFHGRRTANGERYDMHAMTAAHRTLPLPSFARISNPANGRSVIVRVNDRGPFIKGRIVDLSWSAAQRLGIQGLAAVRVVRITPDEIRRGTWQGAPAPIAPLIEGDEPPIEPAANPNLR